MVAALFSLFSLTSPSPPPSSTPETTTDGGAIPATRPPSTFPEAVGEADLLVIGSGVAGCSTALKAAELGRSVTMLTAVTDPHQVRKGTLFLFGASVRALLTPPETSLVASAPAPNPPPPPTNGSESPTRPPPSGPAPPHFPLLVPLPSAILFGHKAASSTRQRMTTGSCSSRTSTRREFA